MKLLYKQYRPQLRLAMVFLMAGLFLESCSKGKEKSGIGEIEEGTKLIVSVLGISDLEDVPQLSLKAGPTPRETVNEKDLAVPEMVSFPAFDALYSVERETKENTKVVIGRTSKGSSKAGLRAAAMETGVKYRLLLYNKADGAFVSSSLLESGVNAAVDANIGTEYLWYALSYNNEEEVPDVDPLNPVLDLPGGKDVLYASGEVAVPVEAAYGTNVPLGIVFKHSLARVAIELNTMGMFANMNSAAVSVSGLAVKTGTMDLRTGEISNLSDYTQTLDYSNFVDVDPLYQDRKIAYAYTAEATPMTDLTVTITDLELQLDDNSVRSFASLLSANPSVFTFNVTPVIGTSYKAIVNLIESPLTVGSVRWARQNIYYQEGHNPFRFHHTYAHTKLRNSYFSFGSAFPRENAQEGSETDPCAMVYPAGVWRQATREDFLSLPPASGTSVPVYGSVVQDGATLGYFEYTQAIGTGAPYPNNNLRFNFNGGSISVGLLNNLLEIDLGDSYGSNVQYWTSSRFINLPPLVTLGAYGYTGRVVNPILGSNYHSTNVDMSLLEIGILGLGVIESNYKNVRCVRQ